MARSPTYHKEPTKYQRFFMKVFYTLGILMAIPFLSGYLFLGYRMHRKNNVRKWNQ